MEILCSLVVALSLLGLVVYLIRKIRFARQMRCIRSSMSKLADLTRHNTQILARLPKRDPERLWLDLAEWLVRGANQNSRPREVIEFLFIRLESNFFSGRPALKFDKRLAAILQGIVLCIEFTEARAVKPDHPDLDCPSEPEIEWCKTLIFLSVRAGLYQISAVQTLYKLIELSEAALVPMVESAKTPSAPLEVRTSGDTSAAAVVNAEQ